MSGDSVRVAQPLFPVEGQGSIPMSPLQFEIEIIDQKKAMLLNKMWHSRMPRADFYNICNPCFGAIYKNIYYASAMWSLPMAANRLKNGSFCLELRRLAINDDAPKNTASRIICIMSKWIKVNMPHIYKLISYQDTGVHSGTIYKASGWQIASKCKFVSWSVHSKRPGKIQQSMAPKIRWEKQIRPEPEPTIKPSKKSSQKGLFF